MSDDLEKQLQAALRHVDPPPGFAARVSARAQGARRHRWMPLRYPLIPAALTASILILICVLIASDWRQRRERQQGLAARQQLIEALRLTGEKLDLAYRGVQDASNGTAPGNAGDT